MKGDPCECCVNEGTEPPSTATDLVTIKNGAGEVCLELWCCPDCVNTTACWVQQLNGEPCDHGGHDILGLLR
jgi:hypothetical protein